MNPELTLPGYPGEDNTQPVVRETNNRQQDLKKLFQFSPTILTTEADLASAVKQKGTCEYGDDTTNKVLAYVVDNDKNVYVVGSSNNQWRSERDGWSKDFYTFFAKFSINENGELVRQKSASYKYNAACESKNPDMYFDKIALVNGGKGGVRFFSSETGNAKIYDPETNTIKD